MAKQWKGLPPDFLWGLVESRNSMRLSSQKAAHANMDGDACRKSGSPRLFRSTYAGANVGNPPLFGPHRLPDQENTLRCSGRIGRRDQEKGQELEVERCGSHPSFGCSDESARRRSRGVRRRRIPRPTVSCSIALRRLQSRHTVSHPPCRSRVLPARRKAIRFPTAAFPCACHKHGTSGQKRSRR